MGILYCLIILLSSMRTFSDSNLKSEIGKVKYKIVFLEISFIHCVVLPSGHTWQLRRARRF